LGALSIISLNIYGKDSAIAVVYDNSGSMKGDQIISINYSLQMLISSLDSSDELAVFTQCKGTMSGIPGDDINYINLSNRQESILKIQTDEKWSSTYSGLYSISISNAIRFLRSSHKSKKWLILLTDGEPEPGNKIDGTGLNEIEGKGINIIYVNTDKQEFNDYHRNISYNKGNLLISYLKDHSTAAVIYQTDQNSSKLLSAMESVSKLIIGADETIDQPEIRDNKILISSPVALNSLIIIDQADIGKSSNLVRVTLNNVQLDINKSVIKKGSLNANVYRITAPDSSSKYLESGNFELVFEESSGNKYKRISILPNPELDFLIEYNGTLPEIMTFHSCLCNDSNLLRIRLLTRDKNGAIIPVGIDKTVNIKCKILLPVNIEADALLSNGYYIFNSKSDSLSHFSINAISKGFFNYRSQVYSIIQEKCKRLELVYNRTVLFHEPGDGILSKARPDEIEIIPKINGENISKKVFKDLIITGIKKSGIVNFKIDTLENSWRLRIIPDWNCPCFMNSFKDSIFLKVSSYNICLIEPELFPVRIEVYEGSRLSRCLPLAKIIVILLLILFYILGIILKNRFGRASQLYYQKIENDQYNYSSKEDIWKKTFLVKVGFFHWINRWLVPYVPEKRKITIVKEYLVFHAGKNRQHIILPSKYHRKNMRYCGSPLVSQGNAPVQIDANNDLTIIHENDLIRIKYVPTKSSI
jgi:hypothetical protein